LSTAFACGKISAMKREHSERATPLPSDNSFDEMRLLRKVMDKNWVALRALALGDEYPDLDVHDLLRMAEEQAPDHLKRSTP
jgi:hypothetical protein